MGNPFSLAIDFTPTVTFGLVSGVNRYQPPEGQALLEYTDCIQIDTSINPGNSGGPLFNMKGELIGINGRGSFEKRGRVNSGVGYAISINQIKNFLGHLHAGIDTDHATLGAAVGTASEDAPLAQMVVKQVLDESDACRRGLQAGDQLLSFAGRPMTSANQYKNILGIYPKDWRLPLTVRRDNAERQEVLVRLMGNMADREGAAADARRAARPRTAADPNARAAHRSGERRSGEAVQGEEGLRQLVLQRTRARQAAGRVQEARRLLRRRRARGSPTARTRDGDQPGDFRFEVAEGKDERRPDREARS